MFTLLGATGNVGGKIADILIKKGKKVRLVARSGERLRKLVGPNSQAFAGDITNTDFLAKALTGSDAVFTLIPPNVRASDFMAYARTVSESLWFGWLPKSRRDADDPGPKLVRFRVVWTSSLTVPL